MKGALLVCLGGMALLATASTLHGADNLWSSTGPFGGPVHALATRPGNDQIVYAGTADGVFRSLDGGLNWALANEGIAGRRVRALAVDPGRPLRLLAGTDGGIFRSLDGGGTWAFSGEGLEALAVEALVVDPRDSLRVYAGTDQGFYASDDQGLTWTSANEGLAGLSVRALALEPADTLRLYAGTEAGVFRSRDGGLNWTPASQGLEGLAVRALAVDGVLGRVYAGTDSGVFGSGDRGNAWEPVGEGLDSLAVVSLSVDPFDGLRLYAGTEAGAFRSLDGGASWVAADQGLTIVPLQALWVDPLNGLRLYAGTEAGVFRSLDGGASWEETNSGLAALAVSTLATDPADTLRLYAGTEAGIFRSLNGGRAWTRSKAELAVHALLVDPNPPRQIFAGTDEGVFASLDGGQSWSPSSAGLAAPSVRALVADPEGGALFAGTDEGVFASLDGGQSWSPSSAGLAAPSVRALVADPEGGALFAGTDEGVFASLDGGQSWLPSSAGLTAPSVRALAFDGVSGRLYAGTDGGVFRSLDGGRAWEGINAGLTVPSIRALAVDTADTLRLYAGTRGGVFRSLDGGDNWEPIETGLTHTDVRTVAIGRTSPQQVYIGTVRGGAFGIALAGSKIDLTASPSSIRANGEDISTLRAVVQDAFGGPVTTDNSTLVLFAITDGPGGDLEASSVVVREGVAHISFTAGTVPGPVSVEVSTSGLGIESVDIFMSRLIPEIGLSDKLVDFGVSAQPVNKSLVLYNRGDADLTISLLFSTKPEQFTVSPDTGFSIIPGDSVGLDLRFEPSTLFASIEASLVLITNDPNDQAVTVDLKAGSQKPQIQVSVSDTLFFPPVAVGAVGEEPLIVENSGTGLLTVDGIASNDLEQFAVSPQAFVLEPGQDTTVVVAFGPLEARTVEASLGIISDDPDNIFLDLPMKGRGIKPRLDIEPRALEFSAIAVGQPATQILTLANSGEADLFISDLRSDDEQVSFESLSSPLPLQLGPGDSTSVQVIFQPNGRGLQEGILAIVSTDLDQATIDVPWTGTGVAPVLEVLVDSLDFGAVPVGRTKVETLLVRNRGDVVLNLSQPAVDDPLFELSLSAASLSPGDTAAVRVSFAPLAIDVFSAAVEEVLSLASNGGLGTVALRARVIDERVAVYNYPNPVRRGQSTTFWFAGLGAVEIKIFNTAGELVEVLKGGQGSHTLAWDGTDSDGRAVNPGLYVFVYSEEGRLRQRQFLQINP